MLPLNMKFVFFLTKRTFPLCSVHTNFAASFHPLSNNKVIRGFSMHNKLNNKSFKLGFRKINNGVPNSHIIYFRNFENSWVRCACDASENQA